MEENKELHSNQQQEKQLPPWAQDIKISYDAYETAYRKSEIELGTLSHPGRINEKYQTQIRERFYEFLGDVRDQLPEFIPIRKGTLSNLDITTSLGPINLSANPSTEYFIPRKNMIYRINPIAPFGWKPEPIDSKCIPENENFVGVNAIIEHPPFGVYLNSLDPPYGPLTTDRIDVILKSLENSIQQESNKTTLQATKQEIQELYKRLEAEYSNTEDLLAQQLKTRVLNLRDSVARHFRLPKQIGGFSVNVNKITGDRKDNREVYFLTEEGRLVLVPMIERKTFFGKAKNVLDFTQVEDAPNKQWIRTGLLPSCLIRPIPRNIRDVIKSS